MSKKRPKLPDGALTADLNRSSMTGYGDSQYFAFEGKTKITLLNGGEVQVTFDDQQMTIKGIALRWRPENE